MTVYIRAHVVGEAIDSVLAQSFSDFELLLIDDGSSDGSVELIRRYSDPRIRLVVHDRNQGIPRTRNHGLEEARGEYLALLDSDELLFVIRGREKRTLLEAAAHAENDLPIARLLAAARQPVTCFT